jgi:hypothetical protein
MSTRGNAPMTRTDVPEASALFFRAFRDGRAPSRDFLDYFEALFFCSPVHDPANASFIHRADDGTLDGALLVIPMQVSVGGQRLTGRLMSNYMTDPRRKTRGGAELVLTIRSRNQDFCFSDSANHVSADHWKAVGGHVLPIQSLDFRRVFRPLGMLVHRGRHRLGLLRAPLQVLARVGDAVLRRFAPRLVAPGGAGVDMTSDAFIAAAPTLVAHFHVHPVWSAQELGWLLAMASENTVNGPLRIRAIHDASGKVTACAVFYARPRGVARVLNLMALPGYEPALIADLLGHLDALGCLAVEGMAQPFAMEALSRQPGMTFVPRGFYCISTRHAEIVDAARRGDVYLGGLMGEDWSRLVTDFHD